MSTSTPDPLNRPRGGNGAFVRSLDTAERDAKAARLRAEGKTYQQIADALELSDKGHAHQCVSRALTAIVREPAEQLRALMLERLTEAYVVARDIMIATHYAHSGGKVVYDPDTGKPLPDPGPRLAAADRVVNVLNREAKLLGLDAAVKVNLLTLEQVQAEIERLQAEVDNLPTEEGE